MNVGEIKLICMDKFDGYDPTGCHADVWYSVIQKVSDEGYPDEQVRDLFRSRSEEEAQEFYRRRMGLDLSEFTCSDCDNRSYVNAYNKKKHGEDVVFCFYGERKHLCDGACQFFNKRGVK